MEPPNLQPIETVDQGYRFRSRLEARWAVFFDHLGLRWEYEKQGYDLDGLAYLPDFWLPSRELWVEIKGQDPTSDEIRKCERLCMATQQDVLLWVGDALTSERVAMYDSQTWGPYDAEAIREGLALPGWVSLRGGRCYSFVPFDADQVEDIRTHWLADPDEYGGLAQVRAYLRYGGFTVKIDPTSDFLFKRFDTTSRQWQQAGEAMRAARFERS